MTVLDKNLECFVQICDDCGTIFKYSMSDINREGDRVFTKKYTDGVITSHDFVICPTCGEVLHHSRKAPPICWTLCIDNENEE